MAAHSDDTAREGGTRDEGPWGSGGQHPVAEPENGSAPGDTGGINVSALSGAINVGSQSNVYIGHDVSAAAGQSPPQPGSEGRRNLAEQRQRFFFDFLDHSLRQAEWTFRLSVWFMSGGAAVLLAGGVLALVHAQAADLSYLPVVTSLTGTLITVGGGALAVQARRARSHVTEQADRMDVKIDLDHKLDMAIALIERVNDPGARDRLHAAAAIRALDMQSSPEVMVDRLLPGRSDRRPELDDAGGPSGS
ncbi:TRADD-N-associated membrane domain-containing protein [Streptomyces spiramenti]|uniref:TRADD-N-associated membrane domain-containing protein n=1 Tax=Streptomyces spiramenti TaxID=2720606 RepID=UPI001ADDCB4E|nr:hypothetical protein [Streptomyces spiramenti]